jgi:hypothetical protein
MYKADIAQNDVAARQRGPGLRHFYIFHHDAVMDGHPYD